MTINYTQKAGDSLTAGELAAFQTAASAWEAVLTDNVTVNFSIGFTALGTGILGGSTPTGGVVSYASLVSQMTADSSSSADASAIANLPRTISGSTSVIVTTAQARALGYSTPGVSADAVIEFSTAFNFADARNGDGTIGSGEYDLVGIAEHEIGHALGFFSDVGGTLDTVLDLFRYQTGSTALSFTTGQAASFSIDGGTTDIMSFSTGSDYQASHWLNNASSGGVNLLMDPAIGTGMVQNIEPIDLLAMDVIGWNVAVPEPGSMMLAGSGLAMLARARRRRVRM